jgi:hypothetical protein
MMSKRTKCPSCETIDLGDIIAWKYGVGWINFGGRSLERRAQYCMMRAISSALNTAARNVFCFLQKNWESFCWNKHRHDGPVEHHNTTQLLQQEAWLVFRSLGIFIPCNFDTIVPKYQIYPRWCEYRKSDEGGVAGNEVTWKEIQANSRYAPQ